MTSRFLNSAASILESQAPACVQMCPASVCVFFAFANEKGRPVGILIDILVLLGVAGAVGIGVLYVYLADGMVSGR